MLKVPQIQLVWVIQHLMEHLTVTAVVNDKEFQFNN